MNDRAELLVRLLDEKYGLTIAEEIAREDVSSHVDHVAGAMRIGRQAAKLYVTDEVISGLADRIAREVDRQLTKQALSPKGHLRLVLGSGGDGKRR